VSPLREVCLANLESANGFFRYKSWNRRLRPLGELHMLHWNTQGGLAAGDSRCGSFLMNVKQTSSEV
jgi:hypothetical protein